MYITHRILIILSFFFFIIGCKEKQKEEHQFKKLTDLKEIVIVTSIGNLQFKLYSETPKHSDNFYQLVKNGFYNNSLFHLIIPEYTIQGGEFQSYNKKNSENGTDNPDTWIETEVNSNIIHKKGTLSALRLANELNPDKKSNPHQFFIVLGKGQSELGLKMVESKINQQLFYENFSKKHPYRISENSTDSQINRLKSEYENNYLKEYTEFKEPFMYSKEQRKIYKTMGGLPQLDMNYTVFGELIEGWEVLDKLGAVMTDKNYVPTQEIKVKMYVVE